MKEIVIISGKGGTGKTSVTAAFAVLAERPVLVDGDVDAADLHLVLAPTIRETHEFRGGYTARIMPERCRRCGLCADLCRFDAVTRANGASGGRAAYRIDPVACEGCGVCAHCCPHGAIVFEEAVNGHWFHSETRAGPMVHARLGVAEENSGKLVTLIRREGRALADARGSAFILVDGPPGIGCPVIASLSGTDYAVIVTEPTVSGIHDMERVASLAAHFRVPSGIIINKADLNPANAGGIAAYARAHEIDILGEIPYDPVITRAQLAGQSVVEFGDNPAGEVMRAIWRRLQQHLKEEQTV